MPEERVEVTPLSERGIDHPTDDDQIMYEVRNFVVKIRTHARRSAKLPNFESSRASDESLRLFSMVEKCIQFIRPMLAEYTDKASKWYASEEAEKIKADLVFAYREELRPDGTIKATGRPAYKPASTTIENMDKDMLAKLLLAELEKRKQ